MKAAIMVAGPQGGTSDIREVQRPVVPPGQILIRVHASSINRAEFGGSIRCGRSGQTRSGGAGRRWRRRRRDRRVGIPRLRA